MHVGAHPGARGDIAKLEPGGTRHAGELRNDAVEYGAHRKVGIFRLDAARIQARDIQQRVEQIAERGKRHPRLLQVAQVLSPERALADGFQKQQRRTQGLAQIVAGGGEKAGLGFIGPVGGLLRLLERQLNFAPGRKLPLQAQIELLALFGALANGLFQAGGRLKP